MQRKEQKADSVGQSHGFPMQSCLQFVSGRNCRIYIFSGTRHCFFLSMWRMCRPRGKRRGTIQFLEGTYLWILHAAFSKKSHLAAAGRGNTASLQMPRQRGLLCIRCHPSFLGSSWAQEVLAKRNRGMLPDALSRNHK